MPILLAVFLAVTKPRSSAQCRNPRFGCFSNSGISDFFRLDRGSHGSALFTASRAHHSLLLTAHVFKRQLQPFEHPEQFPRALCSVDAQGAKANSLQCLRGRSRFPPGPKPNRPDANSPALPCTAEGLSCPACCQSGGGLLPRHFTLTARGTRPRPAVYFL